MFLAALLPLVGIFPTLRDGIINAADGQAHLHRIVAMTTLMRQGDFWPRWVPYLHLGYGYPLFNFYPPGTAWIGGLLGLVGISAPAAFTLIMAAAWIFGTVGLYALAKRLLPLRAALLSAMLWAYALPRLQEIWSQGSLAQMAAVACVPWFALGLLLTVRQPSRRHAVLIALPLAGILLFHLPTAVLTALFTALVVALLVLVPLRRDRALVLRRIGGLGSGVLLGAGLAAIFLVPMAAELRYVSAATGSGADYLADNFLQFADLFIQPGWLDVTDTRLVIAPTLGLLPGLLALSGLIALIVRRRFGLAALLAGGIALMMLLTQPLSAPIWLSVPFMSQLRFPWRSLYVGGLFAALAGGAILLLLPVRWRSAGLVIGLLAVLAAALPWTYPARESLHWDSLTAADEVQLELDAHLWGLTSYDEFQPMWGASVPLDAPDVAVYAEDPLHIGLYGLDLIRDYPALQAEQIDDNRVRVTLTEPLTVRFRQYYYPGWTATLDGQPADIYPEDEIGLIALDMPAGEHVIALHYAGTPIQTAGTLLTLLCLGIAGALVWTGRRNTPDEAPQPAQERPLDPRLVIGIGLGAVLFAGLYAWVIIPQTGWLHLASPPDAPVTMQTPVGATFGELYEFLGYSLDQTTVTPGGALDITVYWRMAGEPDGRTYRPVIQMVNLTHTAAWGVSRDNGVRYRDIPPDRFLSDQVRVILFEGIPPYVGHIKVQVVDMDSGAALPLPDGSDFVLLEPLVRVQGSDPAPQARLDARLNDQIRLECAAVEADGEDLRVDLFWQVMAAPERDATVFIHALDTSGQAVSQYDGPPLGGNYPTGLWQAEQHLAASYTLPNDPAITQLAVGMFWPDTLERLPVTQAGQPAPDGLIRLPLEAAPCR